MKVCGETALKAGFGWSQAAAGSFGFAEGVQASREHHLFQKTKTKIGFVFKVVLLLRDSLDLSYRSSSEHSL